MTAVLPPTFAGASPLQGRHRAPDNADTGSLGPIPAGMRGRGDHQAPHSSQAPRSAPAPFGRAARTAGLSLAALGALATAGGVAAHGLPGSDEAEPQATGEFQLPTDLAAQHMALAPAATPAVQPHAVMPAVAPAPAAAQQQIKTVAAPKAAPKAPTRVAAAHTEAPAAAPQAAGVKALNIAKQALGTPYEWGGTSPGGFDCSGLMQWAWGKAGKDLPRTSAAQAQEGQKVSTSNLQPGDLIFFYSPVSHVAMYAGNGMVIEAPDEGQDVKMTPLSKLKKNMVSARRV